MVERVDGRQISLSIGAHAGEVDGVESANGDRERGRGARKPVSDSGWRWQMNQLALDLAMELAERLAVLIPMWIEQARKAGELTPEEEAEYQQRQATGFGRASAQQTADGQ